jgi:cobalt-zinc-cadmium efflux system protein
LPHHHQHAYDDEQHHQAHQNQKTLFWVLLLTLLYLGLEISGGIISGSLALIADGFHMVSDATGILIALFASWLSARKPPPHATYGYARVGVLAALVNALLILGMALFILVECYQRIQSPATVQGGMMLGISTGGLLVNLLAAKLLHHGHQHNLNMKGAYLHVISDLLGSAGAILASLAILFFHWYWMDPLVSLLVAGLLFTNGSQLLKDCLNILMEKAPDQVPVHQVRQAILSIEGIEDLHHLHIWPLTINNLIVTAHLVVDAKAYNPETLMAVETMLKERFQLLHTTFQMEMVSSTPSVLQV